MKPLCCSILFLSLLVLLRTSSHVRYQHGSNENKQVTALKHSANGRKTEPDERKPQDQQTEKGRGALRVWGSARPSLNDYIAFHGMFCSVPVAQRCIASFNGQVLLMPHDYGRNIESYEWRNILNLVSYYLFVLVTLTGLSTVLGQRTIHVAQEVDPPTPILETLSAFHNENLVMDEAIREYLKDKSEMTELWLQRRFEYQFGGWLPLSIMMLHVVSGTESDARLHLVEIYEA